MDLRTRTEHFPPNARWADVRREYTTHTGLNQVASLFFDENRIARIHFQDFCDNETKHNSKLESHYERRKDQR